MKNVKIFKVLNKDGKVVFKGSANEIGKRFNRDADAVRFSFKYQQRLCWKYRLVEETAEERNEEEYKSIRWHINTYGNTISLMEPTYFIKRLASEGISVIAKENGNEWVLERC